MLSKSEKTIIEIIMNPQPNLCLTQRPKISFYGNENAKRLKQKWNENEFGWNENVFPRLNIERLLNEQFDESENVGAILSDLECAMCLEFNNQNEKDAIPTIICAECNTAFHRLCLLQWFNSLETAKRRFTFIEAKCPHCSQKMTLSLC